MHILSDYALEYGVCKSKNGVLRTLSAVMALIGIVSIVPAIVYRYYFFIIVGVCLILSILLEEIVKRREYTIRYEVDDTMLVGKKIGLDGKTTVLQKVMYQTIDEISLESGETDENGVVIPENDHCVKIKSGGESARYAFDDYMYAVICARVKENGILG